jgi:hypothetical protein
VLAVRARALDNRRPHAYVNRCGQEGGFDFVGGSVAVRPDGEPALALGHGPALEMAELDLDAAPVGAVDYLSQVRSDLPVRLVNPNVQGVTR